MLDLSIHTNSELHVVLAGVEGWHKRRKQFTSALTMDSTPSRRVARTRSRVTEARDVASKTTPKTSSASHQREDGVKVLCIGDPHFKINSIERGKKFADATVRLALERRPHEIVIMGDTLDRFSQVSTYALTEAVSFILRLAEVAHVFLIIGNHDLPNNSSFLSQVHAFTSMKKCPNVTVVDVPVMKDVGGVRLVLAPYVKSGRLVEALDSLLLANGEQAWRSTNVVVFGHSEVEGCKLNESELTSRTSDVWLDSYPLAVMGHIHKRQWVRRNVRYVGSPYQHAFDESEDKTVSIFTFYPPSVEAASNTVEFDEELVSLDLPKLVVYELSARDVSSFRLPKDVTAKIIVRGTVSENIVAKKLPVVKRWREAGAKVDFRDLQTLAGDTSNSQVHMTWEARKDKTRDYGVQLRERMQTPELTSLFDEIFRGLNSHHHIATPGDITSTNTQDELESDFIVLTVDD